MTDMVDVYSDTGSSPIRAPQACLSCRRQKRKCDKALPGCSICTRLDRLCDYSNANNTPSPEDFAHLKQRIADLESILREKSPGTADISSQTSGSTELSVDFSTPTADGLAQFPSMFFLDAEIFGEARISILRPVFPVHGDVISSLGSIFDIGDIVDQYFASIHCWLPMVSKKRTQLALQHPFFKLTPDFALLLMSMKLVIQSGAGNPQGAQTLLYRGVKSYLAFVIAKAMMTVATVQSALLVAVYEIGHAIYPAAYLTTGECVRLCHALGINDQNKAPQMLRNSGTWTEIEERKRVWWAALLLDRYVNLGSKGRPLAAEDPSPMNVLPADDTMWDDGEMSTSEPLYITSPTNIRAGAFQRTCQAAHLLGKLFHLINDNQPDEPFRFSEAMTLRRACTALTLLLPAEVQQAPNKFGTSLALCYSLLLNLYDPFACSINNRGGKTAEEAEMQATSVSGLKSVAAETLQLAQHLKTAMTTNSQSLSPLVIECIYQSAGTYAWQGHETGSAEAISAYHYLREILAKFNQRWAAAGEYLKALDAARETIYGNNGLL